jgi:hypothetical protein
MSGTPITRREALKQSAALLATVYAGAATAEPVRKEPTPADWPMAKSLCEKCS